ncbi:MAG: CPBP family intramembrane glutamic endopeptidase [Ornithinimicrobium sp.]|jgi:membrane protease YdiL (CAAX protease family)|uniref:CPBP family intramembrane glutamic endopeptidase n=1 Tax=Ornithinimicrobium sp. TaxID=1977084 RepID=UPI003D9BE2B0
MAGTDTQPRTPRELYRFLRAALVEPVPRDHHQSDRQFVRRRVVAGVTLVVGSFVLGFGLTREPGSTAFYVSTVVLALVWTIGAFVSGPLHLGWAHTRSGDRHARPIIQSLALGALAVGIFCAGAVVVAQFAFLRDPVNDVLDYARFASLPMVAGITFINGVAEELFFRGAVFAAIGRTYPVQISTVLYALATVATLNLMLVFAAGVLGTLVGLQRRVTGGVLGPIVTHLTWSLSLLFLLPPLLAALTPME